MSTAAGCQSLANCNHGTVKLAVGALGPVYNLLCGLWMSPILGLSFSKMGVRFDPSRRDAKLCGLGDAKIPKPQLSRSSGEMHLTRLRRYFSSTGGIKLPGDRSKIPHN